MTANPLLTALIPLVADLSRELPEAERYRRLLQALRQLLPCDAVALLKLDGDVLIPLAGEGSEGDQNGARVFCADDRQDAFTRATAYQDDSNQPVAYSVGTFMRGSSHAAIGKGAAA